MTIYNKPKITVLMPVYNCELYIIEAVDSILNQNFYDFELLIIDDSSTDKTVDIIKMYNDSRIKLIEKPINTGITKSLNLGLELAKGEYIARMDGDDISLPDRFSKQVAFLDSNLNVVVCGSNLSIINSKQIIQFPEKNEEIKTQLLKGNCIAHPSVMIRNDKLQQFKLQYDLSKEPAEDYDFWVRLLKVGEIYNLQEVLLNYRVHINQVSQKREVQQIQSALESRIKMLTYLNYSFDEKEYSLLKSIMSFDWDISFIEIKMFFTLKQKMILANSDNFFDSKALNQYLLELQRQNLKKYFIKRNKYTPITYFRYLQIKDENIFKLKGAEELKLFLKSITCFKRK